jgi:glycosyltransferase involved in cell wall biosynthesis
MGCQDVMAAHEELDVALIGHPLAPIGRGEDIRCAFRSFAVHGARVALCDVYQTESTDVGLRDEFGRALGEKPESTLANIFFINGDEVEACLFQVRSRLPTTRRNIICPVWELPAYPKRWIPAIEEFDEVWAASKFIADGLTAHVSLPVRTVPMAVEPRVDRLVGRTYFGIPGSSYVFLFFFDFQSFVARKNPQATIAAFGKLIEARPYADVRLVVKTHNGDRAPAAYREFMDDAKAFGSQLMIIDETMNDWEVKNLVRCSDCFLSLHRAEGFGRGLAESMYFGKPVIATGYSGNCDFMSEQNAIPVPFRLVPVEPGAYPDWEGQCWAEPDVEFAARAMVRLLDDPEQGNQLGRQAQRYVTTQLSHLAIGDRYLQLLAS